MSSVSTTVLTPRFFQRITNFSEWRILCELPDGREISVIPGDARKLSWMLHDSKMDRREDSLYKLNFDKVIGISATAPLLDPLARALTQAFSTTVTLVPPKDDVVEVVALGLPPLAPRSTTMPSSPRRGRRIAVWI